MAEDILEINLDEREIKAFWDNSYQRGEAFLTTAQSFIRDYVIQEKKKGGCLSEDAKTGIYAYHFDYAHQALSRLLALPPEQKIVGNELQNIQVSFEFVQEMSPNLRGNCE